MLLPFVGRDFFPTVDAGQFRLHVRAPAGTRSRRPSGLRRRRGRDPPDHPGGRGRARSSTTSACRSRINLAFSDSATIGLADGEILVALKPERHRPTEHWIKTLRGELPARVPGRHVLLPAGRHRQPDPELRPAGADRHAGRRVRPAGEPRRSPWTSPPGCARIPGVVDVHLHQVVNVPKLHVEVDRTRAAELGLTQHDVANSVLVSLARAAAGVAELLGRPEQRHQVPRRRADAAEPRSTRVDTLMNTTVDAERRQAQTQLLGNVADARAARGRRPWSATPTSSRSSTSTPTCRAATSAAWPARCRQIVAEYRAEAAAGQHDRRARPGGEHELRVRPARPGAGLRGVLVYLLMVVNFQTWLDPFIIITALPAGFGRHRVDAVRRPTRRSACRPDGRDHVRRRGDGQQHPDGHVRQRAAASKAATPRRGRAGGRRGRGCGRC